MEPLTMGLKFTQVVRKQNFANNSVMLLKNKMVGIDHFEQKVMRKHF